MIEVGEVDDNAQCGCHKAHARSLAKLCQTMIANGIPQISQHHEGDDEQIIIGHLHVVGLYLKRREQCRDDKSPHVFATISQHNTCYHRRQISQGYHLPDVSGSDDDEEVAAERPYYGAEHSQLTTEVECT